jgi:hypothetical protein
LLPRVLAEIGFEDDRCPWPGQLAGGV